MTPDTPKDLPECQNGHGPMGMVDDGGVNFWAECSKCGETESTEDIGLLDQKATGFN